MSTDATEAGDAGGDEQSYVHRPEGDRAGEHPAREEPAADAEPPDGAGFGPRGWLLVGVVVLSTLVIPGIIYLYPAAPADAGLPFLVAMLALPMVPAVLLGAAAVWSMSASRRTDGE